MIRFAFLAVVLLVLQRAAGLDDLSGSDPASTWLCYESHPIQKCTAFGITVDCIFSYDHDGPLTDSIRTGHLVTAVVLFALAVRVVYAPFVDFASKGLWKSNEHVPTSFARRRMSYTVAGYAIITAFFALTRLYYDTSKILLIGAAVHNLCEWAIAAQIWSTYRDATRFLNRAATWIWLVIVITFMVPNLRFAILVEQTTGVSLDYFICSSFFALSWKHGREASKNPTNAVSQLKRSTFETAKWASILHFGQIWTLIIPTVFKIGEMGSAVIEGTLFFTAGLTFYFYNEFAYKFDYLQDKASHGDAKEKLVEQTTSQKAFLSRWIPCLVVGFLTIAGGPRFLPPCPHKGESSGMCTPGSATLTGTAVGIVNPGQEDAFEQLIFRSNLIQRAREAEGNVDYTLLRNTAPETRNHYRFVETWQSREVLERWLKEARTIFGSAEMKSLLQGESVKLAGPYHELEKCGAPDKFWVGGTSFVLESTIPHVWDVITSIDKWQWLHNIGKATVNGPSQRTLFFKGQTGAHVVETMLTPNPQIHAVTFSRAGGPQATNITYRLSPTKDNLGTFVSVSFEVAATSETAASAAIADRREEFESAAIPHLQEFLKSKLFSPDPEEFAIDAPVAKVWGHVGNWYDASWLRHADGVYVLPDEPNQRVVTFKGNSWAQMERVAHDKKQFSLHYRILFANPPSSMAAVQPGTFEGFIKVVGTSSTSCLVQFRMRFAPAHQSGSNAAILALQKEMSARFEWLQTLTWMDSVPALLVHDPRA